MNIVCMVAIQNNRKLCQIIHPFQRLGQDEAWRFVSMSEYLLPPCLSWKEDGWWMVFLPKYTTASADDDPQCSGAHRVMFSHNSSLSVT